MLEHYIITGSGSCQFRQYVAVCFCLECICFGVRGPGLSVEAAGRKWKQMFADPATKKDQQDAVNTDGQAIGKAGLRFVNNDETLCHSDGRFGIMNLSCSC